ncbi:hypothetical protein ACP70R_047891 [Stipagrostis hirtigluma subsp. patula]
MDALKKTRGHTPFEDMSNTISTDALEVQLQPLCTPDTIKTVHNLDVACPTSPTNPRRRKGSNKRWQAKLIRERKRYANMTPEQRTARRERQRVLNTTPEQKESRRLRKARQRELQRNTLHPDSIAMENPMYIHEAWP